MPWINLRPANSGGPGKERKPPLGKVYPTGELTLTRATAELLGTPDRVLISYNPDSERIRIVPTTPNDNGGFALSGGGNASHRISAKQMVTSHSNMIGDYTAIKITGGVELRKAEDRE